MTMMPTVTGGKAVAIVGMSPASREMGNYEPDEVEIWGLNNARQTLKRIDRLFQIHQRFEIDEDPEYLAWLQSLDVPVYMLEKYDDIPTSVAYPFGEVAMSIFPVSSRYMGDYWTSTIAFMMSLAIYEGFEEIHLWGIDMATGTEYEQQKACIEFWIGAARMKGICVVIPTSSPLCKNNPDGTYGLCMSHRLTASVLKETLGNLERQRMNTEDPDTLQAVSGAYQITRKHLNIADPKTKDRKLEFDFIDQPLLRIPKRSERAVAESNADKGWR